MSQRPGIAVTHMVPIEEPPWPYPNLPNPRSQRIHGITAEVRIFWPTWATREQIDQALAELIAKVTPALDARHQEPGS